MKKKIITSLAIVPMGFLFAASAISMNYDTATPPKKLSSHLSASKSNRDKEVLKYKKEMKKRQVLNEFFDLNLPVENVAQVSSLGNQKMRSSDLEWKPVSRMSTKTRESKPEKLKAILDIKNLSHLEEPKSIMKKTGTLPKSSDTLEKKIKFEKWTAVKEFDATSPASEIKLKRRNAIRRNDFIKHTDYFKTTEGHVDYKVTTIKRSNNSAGKYYKSTLNPHSSTNQQTKQQTPNLNENKKLNSTNTQKRTFGQKLRKLFSNLFRKTPRSK